jgi:hypothetical protein
MTQAQAECFLLEHGLSRTCLEQLEKRWSVTSSNKWKSGDVQRKRVLYQCICGYSTEARRKTSKSKSVVEWTRRATYDFTGCCAHADITYNESTGHTERIIGHFLHNLECKAGKMMRFPAIPLHEHVYEVALAQLFQGAR